MVASTPKDDRLSRRLFEERIARSLTQADIDDIAGFEPGITSELEDGRRKMTLAHAALYAEALRMPLDWFLREEPAIIASRRNALFDTFDDMEEEFRFLYATVTQLVSEGILHGVAFEKERLPDTPEDTEMPARRVRERVSKLEPAFPPDGPIADVSSFCEQLGLLVFPVSAPGSSTFGVMSEIHLDRDDRRLAIAAVNVLPEGQPRPGATLRFTACHELGHLTFGDAYSAVHVGQSEKIVNAFAAHLLMPRAIAEAQWEAAEGDAATASKALAQECGTSWSSAARHWNSLGRLNPREAGILSKKLAEEPNDQEQLRRYYQQPLPQVPAKFAETIRSAYAHDKLTRSRALEALRDPEADLPALMRPRQRPAINLAAV